MVVCIFAQITDNDIEDTTNVKKYCSDMNKYNRVKYNSVHNSYEKRRR